jgi:hypothetical protein
MAGDVLEARNLSLLGSEIHDRVEDAVGEREHFIDLRRRKVADHDLDLVTAGLGTEARDHRFRQIDPSYANTAGPQRQGDPSGTDAELERSAPAGKLGEELNRGFDEPWSLHSPIVSS